MTVCILAKNQEVAKIGDDDESVCTPILADLLRTGRNPGVIFDAFHFNDAPFGRLSLAWLAPLHLIRDIQAEVRLPCARVAQVGQAKNFWL